MPPPIPQPGGHTRHHTEYSDVGVLSFRVRLSEMEEVEGRGVLNHVAIRKEEKASQVTGNQRIGKSMNGEEEKGG